MVSKCTIRGAWLAELMGPATLDLGVVSFSPLLLCRLFKNTIFKKKYNQLLFHHNLLKKVKVSPFYKREERLRPSAIQIKEWLRVRPDWSKGLCSCKILL